MPMICSFVNRLRFIARSQVGPGTNRKRRENPVAGQHRFSSDNTGDNADWGKSIHIAGTDLPFPSEPAAVNDYAQIERGCFGDR